ncbi:MAG: Deoxycytidine triphosphate deaminase [Parcubacteria group bacterium GW2011_GWF2_50_9]|nr:MAG: Deoxycytidine triphosphate deaminase [Parcubacteria group bacterium GW2011_GWF2_50_9]
MFLSDVDIKREVKRKAITIEPFDETRLQPASYDIVLGNNFLVNDAHTSTFIDPANKVFPKTHDVRVADGEAFVLHPGVSILGYSKGSERQKLARTHRPFGAQQRGAHQSRAFPPSCAGTLQSQQRADYSPSRNGDCPAYFLAALQPAEAELQKKRAILKKQRCRVHSAQSHFFSEEEMTFNL